ncbi:Lysozyme inhibitor LprI N-terminal domain-containing protein [Bordetella sputigena]|uniref:UmoC family flagellar biogenesis regulator n=1 Tax=Bordetella sputigena TaxID=1416810 RepID=UPI0039EFB155
MQTTTLRTVIGGVAACAAMLCAASGAHAAEPVTSSSVLNTCASSVADQPRTAVRGCLNTGLKEAQEQMAAAYAQVESGLKQIDSASTPEALHTLKHSQDGFKSFLHKECKRQGAAMMGGTGAGDMEVACQVALTRWRTAQLLQK